MAELDGLAKAAWRMKKHLESIKERQFERSPYWREQDAFAPGIGSELLALDREALVQFAITELESVTRLATEAMDHCRLHVPPEQWQATIRERWGQAVLDEVQRRCVSHGAP